MRTLHIRNIASQKHIVSQAIYALLFLAAPFVFDLLPLHTKINMLYFLFVVFSLSFIIGFLFYKRSTTILSVSIWCCCCFVVTSWVSVLAYSAQVSLVPNYVLLCAFAILAMGPILLIFLYFRRVVFFNTFILCLVCSGMFVTLAITPPAKRFNLSDDKMNLIDQATPISSPTRLMNWVHHNISYAGAPFSDDALDTLIRKRATCGGMSNLLHKLLIAKGTEARIVHFEGRNHSEFGSLHTLVEYFDKDLDKWILLDPQHNLDGKNFRNLDMSMLISEKDNQPVQWKGFTLFYINKPGHGYEKMATTDYKK